MKQFKKLFEAHFKTTFREKQVWFWSIFYPVMLLVVILIIFGGLSDDDSSFQANVALVLENETEYSKQISAVLKQISVLEWKEDEPISIEQAEEWVKNKDIDAVIIFPEQTNRIELLLNKEKKNSTLEQALNGILGEVVHQVNYIKSNIKPEVSVTTTFVSAGSDDLTYTDFLLSGLIALSISQAGLFGMVGMVEMRRNGLLKRLMLAPVSMRMFGLGNIMVRFILSAIQIILLSLIGVFVFGANLNINPISFLLMFLVGTISFSAIGFMIASLSKSMDSYFGIANLASFIMMFLSGIFFEYSMLPEYIKPVSSLLPLTYFADGIRDTMIYGTGVMGAAFWMNIGILLLWALVTYLIAARFYRWTSETN